MDQLTVKIERRDDCTVDRAARPPRSCSKQIKIHVGSSCTVDVVEPGSLERSNGKLRRIYDMRQTSQRWNGPPSRSRGRRSTH